MLDGEMKAKLSVMILICIIFLLFLQFFCRNANVTFNIANVAKMLAACSLPGVGRIRHGIKK